MLVPDIMRIGSTKLVWSNFNEICTERGFNPYNAARGILNILELNDCKYSYYEPSRSRMFLKRTRTRDQARMDKLDKRFPYFTKDELIDALNLYGRFIS